MEMERREDLRARLALVVAEGKLEGGHIRRMEELLLQRADPFARDRFTPGHFTASAFVVSADWTRLLLVLHGKLGRWLQPGGHVDPNDASIVETARREVDEETGISRLSLLSEVPLDVDVHTIPAFGGAPAHEHFDVRFLFRADDDACAAGSDAKDARWFELSSLESFTGSDESVIRAVRKVIRRTAPS